MKRVFLKAARDAIKEQPRDSPVRDGTIGQPVVRQVKLLRATDRFDSKGEGRSKRYGFLEFEHHEHSLLALRRLNNNPDAFAGSEDISKGGRSVRPFVEFALEDVRKLLIRTQKLTAALKRKALKEKQAAELEALEGAKAKAAKPKIKSSEQPTKKAPKPVADPQAGGGRGACFNCGLGGHVAARCPKNADSAAAGEKVKPVAAAPAAAAAAGGKRKATEAAEPPAKKQKAAAPAAAAAVPAESEESGLPCATWPLRVRLPRGESVGEKEHTGRDAHAKGGGRSHRTKEAQTIEAQRGSPSARDAGLDQPPALCCQPSTLLIAHTTAAKSIFTLVLPELSCARMARQQIFSHDRDEQAV